VTVLLNPSLPSCRWLLAGLHHPVHHTLHPDRWLTEVLLFFHLLRPLKLLEFCSWSCHYDWQVQIIAEAADAGNPGIVVHETKELDILVLDGMGPDTMESGPQV